MNKAGNQTEQDNEVKDLFTKTEALLTGHFLLSSGMHSGAYVQCQKVMQYPRYGMFLANILADKLLQANIEVQAVVGPALGAIHLAVFAALALDNKQAGSCVQAIFAERPDGTNFEITRGINLAAGQKVLVVEDVTTTGGSAKKVLDLVYKLKAQPVAVAALVDRSGGQVEFGLPFFSLIKLKLSTFTPETCSFCKDGLSLVKPGTTKIKS